MSTHERSTEAFSRLIHQIYEAAVEPAQWSKAVAAVGASVDAHKAMLFTPYLGPHMGGLVFPWNLEEGDLQRWATRYIADDIWSTAALDSGFWQQEGAVVADEDLVPREVFERSVMYREFLTGIDIGRMCACQIAAGGPGLPATALSVFRPIGGNPFDRDDQAWLRQLVPHLSRALGVMQRLDTARLHAASALSALDRLSFGVALLNERRQVIHLNPAATTAIGRRDGLALNGQNQLDIPTLDVDAPSLPQWLDGIQASDIRQQSHFSKSFLVPRRSMPQRHYALQCSPLPTHAAPAWIAQGEVAHFVVFITDPDAAQLPSVDRLRELYGLTPAQARVARTLAGGVSLKHTASELGISEQTVQSHVKEIYAKIRVNRLPDLVRVLLSLGQAAV